MDKKIIDYYRLCSFKKVPHVLSILTEILSAKEKELYLKQSKGTLVANETIIGGEEMKVKCLVIT